MRDLQILPVCVGGEKLGGGRGEEESVLLWVNASSSNEKERATVDVPLGAG